jgi:hypothetical protein
MKALNLPEDVSTALQTLSAYAGGKVSIHIVLDLDYPEPPPPDPVISEAKGCPKATIRTVQWALNRFKAAAGQPNRDHFRHFLYCRGWIGPIDSPEDWNLNHVPTTKKELAQLAGDFTGWEIDRHQPTGG